MIHDEANKENSDPYPVSVGVVFSWDKILQKNKSPLHMDLTKVHYMTA